MDVREVHKLVRMGLVVRATRYHPGRRGISFGQILAALERCYHVARDDRTDERGRPAHPSGWYALANLPHKRRIRIDFDVHQDRQGKLLLIVTAYHV